MDMRLENRSTWRDYQNRLNRKKGGRQISHRGRWALLVLIGILAVLLLGLKLEVNQQGPVATKETKPFPQDTSKHLAALAPKAGEGRIEKKDIRAWLPSGAVYNLEEKSFSIQVDRAQYRVETTLDMGLQAHLLQKLRTSNVSNMGMVALDPETGKILAMVGVGGEGASGNLCMDPSFPAASVFKIVTAAAAIDECGFGPGTPITFSGGKYTLYKSQVQRTGGGGTTLPLADAFAQSVNPVFGRIGAQNLGRKALDRYGASFGFNRDIDFEVLLPRSNFETTDDTYHLAEISCGLNRITTLSPLHAALIVSAVMNQGKLPAPVIVDRVTDEKGNTLYRGASADMGTAMSSNAARQVKEMMTGTVKSGTGRKAFRGFQKDRVLSRLTIGGKTGSIDNNSSHDKRIDWFVGYASDKAGERQIVVAVVVAHEKYIGTRAGEFARFAMGDYFDTYFTKVDAGRNAKFEKGRNS